MEDKKVIYTNGDTVDLFNEENVINNEQLLISIQKKCVELDIVMPYYCFKTDDERLKYAVKWYFKSKKDYHKTGVWIDPKFWQRDIIWIYYYYLKISDHSLNLDKYLDIDYNTSIWTRSELESLMNKYGKNSLMLFIIYNNLETDKSFDEWYQTESENFSYIQSFNDVTDISFYNNKR